MTEKLFLMLTIGEKVFHLWQTKNIYAAKLSPFVPTTTRTMNAIAHASRSTDHRAFLCHHLCDQRRRKMSSLFLLKFCFPMVLLTAFINPAINTREHNINDIGEMQSQQSNFYF